MEPRTIAGEGSRSVAVGGEVVRRIVGAAMAVLLVATATIVLDVRGRTAGAYEVQAELGRAGAGLIRGSDVKVRGVTVGRVSQVVLDEDGGAVATLLLDPEPPLPAAMEVTVSAKTFLGEKQVELHPEGDLVPPWLEAGQVLQAPEGDRLVEVGAVVAGLEELFSEIDRDALAGLIEALGAFDAEDADLFGRGLEVSAELAGFLDRTGQAQLARAGDAADAFAALETAAPSLRRLATALPDAAAPLVEGQADLRATIEALDRFGTTLERLLTVEEPTLRALLATSDRIGQVLDPRLHHLGEMVYGIYRYSLGFGQQGGELTDGSEFALFRIFLGQAGQAGEFCDSLPAELAAVAPGCTAEGRS